MIRTKILTGLAALLLITASYSFALAGNGIHSGSVIETDTGGGYTYAQVNEDGKKYWIAGPATDIKKGDRVSFDEQIWMSNFKSKGLGRTFERILFVGGILPDTGAFAPAIAAAPARASVPSRPAAPGAPSKPGVPSYMSAAEKHTVSDLFAQKHELAGKNIEVRGTVVKVSKNIMNRTWVHIEDGTSHEGVGKVVFRTTGGAPPVGETVTARGRLEADVDFGAGYFYSVIIEDSSFSK